MTESLHGTRARLGENAAVPLVTEGRRRGLAVASHGRIFDSIYPQINHAEVILENKRGTFPFNSIVELNSIPMLKSNSQSDSTQEASMSQRWSPHEGN